MYCKKCGQEISESGQFCPYCGTSQSGMNNSSYYTAVSNSAPVRGASFGQAIALFFHNYANFRGRSSRSELWWTYLFNTLMGGLFTFLMMYVSYAFSYIYTIYMLACLIPALSIQVRRLHDIGKSWVYLLMGLIPIAGFIILIVYYCTDSKEDNRWGPGPEFIASPSNHNYTYAAYTTEPSANASQQVPEYRAYHCANCGAMLRVPATEHGRLKLKCPKCNFEFYVEN